MKLFMEVAPLRQASRQMIRELGFLEDGTSDLGITHSQCHALIELRRHGTLTAGELSERLNLDKATLSRTVAQLSSKGYVASRADGRDKRRRPLRLTARGAKRLAVIDDQANAQVQSALALLSGEERATVLSGLTLYARALAQRRSQGQFRIRALRKQDDPEVARLIRTVMPEFGAAGPGFAIHDAEVDAMSTAYRGRRARYFVVERNGHVVGGAGFGALVGGSADTCELRKMYFLPQTRGLGMGKKLLAHVIEHASRAGYRRCYLETLKTMVQARRLYEAAGFRSVCKPMGKTGHFGCDRWYLKELAPA